MMNSIFSMFDPMNKMINPFIIMMLLMIKFPNKINKNVIKFMEKKMLIQILINMKNMEKMNFMTSILMKTTFMLVMLNIMSLTPFSWSMTSQPSFNIPLIMSLMMIVIMISLKKSKNLLIHLTPPSTPNILIPFMIMIEMTSWMARPLTLILRLSANMISGHILMFLMGKISSYSETKKSIPLMIMMIPLITLETMVSMIQAYIIFTLLTLYLKET